MHAEKGEPEQGQGQQLYRQHDCDFPREGPVRGRTTRPSIDCVSFVHRGINSPLLQPFLMSLHKLPA
jgi:hypothetical protein